MRYIEPYVPYPDQAYAITYDPTRYLEVLPDLRKNLPIGAWAFASDPDHYDFYSVRCVKDLEYVAMSLREEGGLVDFTLNFDPNPFKHNAGLTIKYRNVSHFEVSLDNRENTPSGKSVRLDEILPENGGCIHEIILLSGSIKVVSSDLEAIWSEISKA